MPSEGRRHGRRTPPRSSVPAIAPPYEPPKYLFMGDLIDDCAYASRGSLGVALIETTIFGGLCLTFQLWALEHADKLGLAFLPLILHRALSVFTDITLLFCNVDQTWFGYTTLEAFSVQAFITRFTRLTDNLACFFVLALAAFSYISSRVVAGAAMSYKMMAFPLWVGTIIQIILMGIVLADWFCSCISCVHVGIDTARNRPRWRRFCVIFLPRLPAILLNILCVPVAIKLDDASAISWTPIFVGAMVMVGGLMSFIVAVTISAALQAVMAPPTHVHALPERRFLVGCILTTSLIVASLAVTTLIKANHELSLHSPSAKSIVIPYAGTTAFLVGSIWTIITAAIPQWRTEYARVHNLHTPSTAAEQREGPATDRDAPPPRTGPIDPPPTILIRLSHHLYRRPTKEDNIAWLQTKGAVRRVRVVSQVRTTPKSPGIPGPPRLAWCSPQAGSRPQSFPSSTGSKPTQLSVSTTAPSVASPNPGRTIDVMSPDSQKLCHLCFANDANAVLLECGHGGLCMDCGTRVIAHRQWQQRRCPLCRCDVVHLIRILPPHLQTSVVVPVFVDSDDDQVNETGRVRSAYRHAQVAVDVAPAPPATPAPPASDVSVTVQ